MERRVYARYRLATFVVTEDVTFTVPMSRQEGRLEQVPLGETVDFGAAAAEGDLVEDVHEVVLNSEEVQFTKTTVAVEWVRLVRSVVGAE